MMIVFEILLLVGGVFLVGSILMQQGKSHGLSGSIAGGAETFFGKEKGAQIDSRLSKATSVIGVVFVVIALVVYVIQPTYTTNYTYKNLASWQYVSSYYSAPQADADKDDTADTTGSEGTTEADTNGGESDAE